VLHPFSTSDLSNVVFVCKFLIFVIILSPTVVTLYAFTMSLVRYNTSQITKKKSKLDSFSIGCKSGPQNWKWVTWPCPRPF